MSSFIDVRRASANASRPLPLLAWLLRKKPAGKPLISDITFSLTQGQWATLYGAPGSGKTTILKMLAGLIAPTSGDVIVNGRPAAQQNLAAGYVSGSVSGRHNSTTEEIEKRLRQAAASDAPVVLLDDVADQLGARRLQEILVRNFENRTVVVSTRFPATAQALNLPILLLHQGALACTGTCDEIAHRLNAPRTLNAWVEGIRYDIFREIKRHPGVADVRLEVDGRFKGQRLSITLKSSRYLPALYDLVSRVPLVRLEEVPVRLEDILKKL